jgi:biotin operon repressor
MSPRQFCAAATLKNAEYRTYSFFISRVHCEIIDPSDQNRKIGIVRLGDKQNPIYELSDDKFAAEFGISANAVMHTRESLRKQGLIVQKNTGRGYKMIVRDSDMFNYVARTADNGYTWVLSLPEFSGNRVSKTVIRENQSHENGDPSHENGDSGRENGDSGRENGDSGAPISMKHKGVTGLIKRIKGIERIQPPQNSSRSSHTKSGQGLGAKDIRNIVRQITKAVQKIAPSVVILPNHKARLAEELADTLLRPRPTLEELLSAATAEANDWGSDDFKIGQGGNLLLAKLITSVEIARDRKKEYIQQQELIRICTEGEQEKAVAETQRLLEAEARETDLIEEHLGE